MALFKTIKRVRRMGVQSQYAKYFSAKKVKGELKSALTLSQWVKAGKPQAKMTKVKKRKAPVGKKKKKILRGTRKVLRRIGTGLTKKEKERLID
jgi:hypothetical protein